MTNFNVKDFKATLATFSDVELEAYKKQLQGTLALMIANPHIGKQLTLVELELKKRKQVSK